MPAMTELLPGILLMIVPIVASPIIAAIRGVHPFPALLLGLFGSWVGFAVVLAFYRPSVVNGLPNSEHADAIEKLRTLDRLRDEGLVDSHEFEERCRKVLETL